MSQTVNPEQTKYEKLWGYVPGYRSVAPGEEYVSLFMERVNVYRGASVIDFGCGTGRGALAIATLCGADVLALDFVPECLDIEVRQAVQGGRLRFEAADLTQPIAHKTAEYGYCTDVMEHVRPEDVHTVLRNVMVAAKRVFFAISTVDDKFGEVLGEPLHLTVQPHAWWREQFESLGARIDWDKNDGEVSFFYVSLYVSAEDYDRVTGLNTTDARIRENITQNLRLGLKEVSPHEAQDVTICLLAGGPSLADHEQEIIERGRTGELFVTVNGTYKWLIDRGIRPAAQIMIDARPFNARFLEPVIDTCRYIFSSQTAHEAVVKVPPEQAWLFHSGDNDAIKACFDEHVKETGQHKEWYPVPGGSTVIGRGLVVLAMLGFRNIEVFGWDSCLRDGAHHAYTQAENDHEHVVDITLGGRSFQCHPWMVIQAYEVPKLIRHVFGRIEGFNLNVRGDGLIAHMLKHAATLAAGKEN